MKLKDYLNERSSNLLKWCRDNNLPYFSIRNILKGQDCFLSTAIQIEEATKGEVRCVDLKPTKVKPPSNRLRKMFVKNESEDQKNSD